MARSYSSDIRGVMFAGLLVLAVILLFGGGVFIWTYADRITEERALPEFQRLTGTQNVTILSHSDNMPIIGSPGDVKFSLVVNGKPANGRCANQKRRGMICTVSFLATRPVPQGIG